MRRSRPPAQLNPTGLPRRRQTVSPQPVPTFQPDSQAPPPQPPPAPEDEAVEAAINRMIEAAYT